MYALCISSKESVPNFLINIVKTANSEVLNSEIINATVSFIS